MMNLSQIILIMLRLAQLQLRRGISSELIKKELEKGVFNPRKGAALEYPKTFEQKVIFLNQPTTIQKLQIVQYGVKYKPGKKYLSLVLFLAGLFFYYNEKFLPLKVIDSYFCISTRTDAQRPSGFLLSAFMYELPFYLYTPLLLVIHQMSKFISNRWVLGLIAANAIINGYIGKQLVETRVKQYEVWDQERISYGDGTLLSLSSMFWTTLGPLGGFSALKSRVMLKSVPGLGITRAGIPISYICLFYMLLESYLWWRGDKKNSELILSSVLTGIIFGLFIRRFSPLK